MLFSSIFSQASRMTRSRSELSTGGAVLSTAASAELDGAGGATTKSRSMAAISRSNTSAKSSSEVFDDPADAAGGGTGWAGEAVGGFELVVACGVGLTGGCFPKASSTSIGKRNARRVWDHPRGLVLQTLDFRTIKVINVGIIIYSDGALFLSLVGSWCHNRCVRVRACVAEASAKKER